MSEKERRNCSSRTKNSIINLSFSLAGQFLNLLSKFLLRTVFVATLGKEYLGLSGLFTNILSLLSLAELGVGTAITFSLYKPIAQQNENQLIALMRVYKKAYICIGLFVLFAGALLTPFLSYFIKDMPDIPYIRIIYLLYVGNSGISYFYSYKASFIAANQKNYIVTNNQYLMNMLCALAQACALFFLHNYLIFLGMQVIFTVASNIRISKIADREYPILTRRTKIALDFNTKRMILSNIGAMVFHKIGAIVVFSTDNILLSKMFGLSIVGVYSNYCLIFNGIESILNQFFQSITASIGNLKADAEKGKQKKIFYIIFFINYWLYSFCAIALGILLQDIMKIWLGEEYLMTNFCVIFLVINFLLKGMRQTVMTFDTAYGLMRFYKIMPIPECLLNLSASILMAYIFGPAGVFIGTTVSTLFTCFWMEPRALFRYGLDADLREYFIRYGRYIVVTLGIYGMLYFLVAWAVVDKGILGFFVKILLVIVVPNLSIIIIFRKTDEFQYIVNIGKRFFKK